MKDGKIFLVTGASGYLSSWVCKILLEEGYIVHGTVRNLNNEKKCMHLKEMQQEFPGKLKLFEADLLDASSFIIPMEGCTHVIHTASPFPLKVKDPEKELVKPAVEGTKAILEAATKTLTVKKIVLTSSMAAIKGDVKDILDSGGCANESIWNTTSNLQHNAYSFSKTEAEKTAWKMYSNQDQWNLVTINPGFILGPSLSARLDSTSNKFMRELLRGLMPLLPNIYTELVDVRDVARAHVLAALNENAEGRYICVNEVRSLIHISKLLRNTYPRHRLPKWTIPKFIVLGFGFLFGFTPKMVKLNYGMKYKVDNSRSVNELGLQYRQLQTTVNDHANQLIEMGLVKFK